ncbi:MAG: hypothetical protein II747_00375 [Clostridia bacterium]|nr:hypothetical protein [Clostridia bacterium]
MRKEDVYLGENPPYMIGGIKTENGKNRIFPIANAIRPLVQEMYDRGKRKLLEMNDDNFRKAFETAGLLRRLAVCAIINAHHNRRVGYVF